LFLWTVFLVTVFTGGHSLPNSEIIRRDDAKFSVVIPTYQRADLVRRAIESVFAQERAPEEIIVVDDGSTDGTREIVEALDGVQYIRQENRGASAARNIGVNVATCDWVAFLDSDDYWLPGHLSGIAEAIYATMGHAAMYFANMIRTEDEANLDLWSLCKFAIPDYIQFTVRGLDCVMMNRQPMMLQASVVRRDIFLELGGLWENLSICHDSHFFFRLCIEYPVCAVSQIGCQMTADDKEHRLAAFGSNVRDEERLSRESYLQHKDILKRYPTLREAQRKDLVSRKASAMFELFRFAVGSSKYLVAAKWITGAFLVDPGCVLALMRNAIRRRRRLADRIELSSE